MVLVTFYKMTYSHRDRGTTFLKLGWFLSLFCLYFAAAYDSHLRGRDLLSNLPSTQGKARITSRAATILTRTLLGCLAGVCLLFCT